MLIESSCCYVLDTKKTPGMSTKTCRSNGDETLVLCSTSTDGCSRSASRIGRIETTCPDLGKHSDVLCVETGYSDVDLYTLLVGDADQMRQKVCSNDLAKSHCFCKHEFSL